MDMFVDDPIPYIDGGKIKVVGVGGAGGNALKNMIEANIGNVEYVAINTDAQALRATGADTSVLISKQGLGAGGIPEKGRQYAMEKIDEISGAISGADMVFITCGLGGGTGTGASPVIAAEAKSSGALTVAVVSIPHTSAGKRRNDIAKAGLEELVKHVDSYIVIPNDALFEVGHKLTHKEAMKKGDDVLRQSIQGICDIIGVKGTVNVDFEDVRTAMSAQGKAVMGIGVATGENRAREAYENAIKNPFLSDTNIRGAYAVIVNVAGNEDDLFANEIDEIFNLVYENVGGESSETHIIDGVVYDDRQDGSISVTIVATGIKDTSLLRSTENVSRISEIKKAVPTEETIVTMHDKTRKIVRDDRNLQGIGKLNEDFLEIPTYLRKQSD